MKHFLFTPRSKDNNTEVVLASSKGKAIELLALDSISDEMIEQFREDNPKKSDKKLFEMALNSEIEFVNEWYDISEINILSSKSLSDMNTNFGKYSDLLKKALVSLGK